MVFGRIASYGRAHPVLFGCGISAFKTSASDYITQVFVEGKEHKDVDWRRNFVFFGWGAAWLGGVQYLVHVHLFTKVLFPSAPAFVAKPVAQRLADKAGMFNVVKQVATDQFLFHPLVVFPIFYQFKEQVEGGTPEAGFKKFKNNFFVDCQMCWSIWVPAQLFNMGMSPLWFRVPFTAVVSFGFTMLLSFVRGAPQELEDASKQKEASMAIEDNVQLPIANTA